MRLSIRWAGLAAAALGLTLTGCGAGPFAPTSAEPCTFLTREEREEYGVQLVTNQPTLCRWGPLVSWDVFVFQMTVEYQDREPDAVALEHRLPPVDTERAKRTTIAFRGPTTMDDTHRQCVLVAPMEDTRSLVVAIGFDITHSRFRRHSLQPDPCDVMTTEFPQIEAKLRRQ